MEKTKLSKNVLTSDKFIDVFGTGKVTSLTVYHYLWVNARVAQELLIVYAFANVSRESQVNSKVEKERCAAVYDHLC